MDTYRCIPLGIPYARIRAFIEETAKTSSITGFGDMTVEEVSRLTGLDARRASLARQREFSEPFVLAREEELHEIERLAHLKGLAITRGGRFYHCMGYGNDKGGSVKRVRISLRGTGGGHCHRLRGQPQRLPLLEAVDIPVLIPHDDGSYEGLDLPGLVHAPYPGSRGWNAAALSVIAGADGGIRDGQS